MLTLSCGILARTLGPATSLREILLVPILLLIPFVVFAQADQVFNDGDSQPGISFSIVEGGLPDGAIDGGGTLDADPLFVLATGQDGVAGTLDDDLRLQENSPAVDAGDNSAVPADAEDFDGDGDTAEPIGIDLDGLERFVDGGIGQMTVDLGAYESGAMPTANEQIVPLTSAVEVIQPYPNPFRSETTISYRLARAAPIQVKLFDALGREVETLYRGVPAPGILHTLRLDGVKLPSGLYIVRLDGADIHTARTVLRMH